MICYSCGQEVGTAGCLCAHVATTLAGGYQPPGPDALLREALALLKRIRQDNPRDALVTFALAADIDALIAKMEGKR